jgi:hypothetical protein
MILIDTVRKDGYCHMVGSSIEELHTFAESIGVKRCWFENKRGKCQPHYDIKGYQITKALRNGAKLVSRRKLFVFLEETYG